MKVLYLDGVGVFGGACRSLHENLTILKDKNIQFFFVIQRGTIKPYYEKFSKNIITSIGLTRFDNTQYSYYRGGRWLILIRELFYIPFTIFALIKAKIIWKKIDIIHVNELTEIISLVIAKIFFRTSKVVIHCRSVYRNNHKSIRNSLIKKLVNSFADVLIAIDNNVKNSLPKFNETYVINNSYSIEEDKQKTEVDNLSKINIGYVGTISEMKGIYDLIDALRLIKKKDYLFHLYVAGEEIRKNRPFLNSILKLLGIQRANKVEVKDIIRKYGLEENITFLGHLSEMNDFYNTIDVLCFPSRLDAPGRPIIEASFYKKPSIACISKSYNDTLQNYKTGIAVDPKNPSQLADAIIYFLKNEDELKLMGERAYANSKKHNDSIKNSERIYNIYKKLKNN